MKGAIEIMSSGNSAPLHPDTALILAAHGSSRRPEANALVDAHAAAIDAKHIFSSVHTVFLTGGPDPLDVIQHVTAQHIIIAPFMMSDGYLVNIITKKLSAAISTDSKRHIRVSEPVGTHPEIAAIAADMAVSTLKKNQHQPNEATIVLVAHGTKLRPESKTGAQLHLDKVKKMEQFAAVHLALLEEAPFIEDVLNDMTGPSAIIGLFAAPGGHAVDDVQTAINKSGRPNIHDTGPIGADPRMINIAIDRALSKIS